MMMMTTMVMVVVMMIVMVVSCCILRCHFCGLDKLVIRWYWLCQFGIPKFVGESRCIHSLDDHGCTAHKIVFNVFQFPLKQVMW